MAKRDLAFDKMPTRNLLIMQIHLDRSLKFKLAVIIQGIEEYKVLFKAS
jgi:hypothetical protein